MNDHDDNLHDSVAPPSGGMTPPPLTVIPLQPAPPPRPPRPPAGAGPSVFRWFFRFVFLLSLGCNFFLLLLVLFSFLPEETGGSSSVYEHYHSGKRHAASKIAIVKMDGVIMEGMTGFAQKQIEEAARDEHVKAVVLRINSPGGSITASDDLYKRLKDLRDGTTPGVTAKGKPIVVSMGALTASGGYYISMPAAKLVAEPTTITGSIGVYASFPNISGLAEKYGFGMVVVKAGEVKDSGSMFKQMTPQEHQLWQDMVDHAYDQFVGIVEAGRPKLKGKMREVIPQETRELTVKKDEKNSDSKEEKVTYIRRRADGGIFTAEKALAYGLVDQIGYLEEAIAEAAKLSNLNSDEYKAVNYEKPVGLMDALLKSQSATPAGQLDASKLSNAAAPRLWYMTGQGELAGILSALGRP
jgi:protease-4